MEWLLTQKIKAVQKSNVIDRSSAKRVAVDTFVMEKNIAYLTCPSSNDLEQAA